MTVRISYCPACDTEAEVTIVERVETYPVRGENVSVPVRVAVCGSCGEDIFDEGLDENNLARAYEIYRSKHATMTAREIASLRHTYGLSQRALARLLGWGEATISRYEGGSVPDKAHDLVLKSLREPHVMEEFLRHNRAVLSEREQEQLGRRMRQLTNPSVPLLIEEVVSLGADRTPTIYNGFRVLDIERLANMAVFFAHQAKTWKTMLMKLLFYADFRHFREFSVSISGSAYARLPMGPVPNHFSYILAILEDTGFVELRPEAVGPYEGEIVHPLRELEDALFVQTELDTLRVVAAQLSRLSASELSELSHQENGWREVPTGQLIPYSYADSLMM